MKLKIFAAIILTFVILTGGCVSDQSNAGFSYDGIDLDTSKFTELESTQELKKFENSG